MPVFVGISGASCLRAAQQFERALVDRALAHLAIEPRHRFHIVIQHVGPRRDHRFQRRPVAAKIRNQHFDLAVRHALANRGNRARENRRAAVRLVVAIHRSHHGIAQTHPLDGLAPRAPARPRRAAQRAAPKAPRRTRTPACRYCPRIMNVAVRCSQHSPMIRAARALAHGVQIERAHDALQVLIIRPAKEFHAQPFRPRMAAGGGVGLFARMLKGAAIRYIQPVHFTHKHRLKQRP